VLLTFTLALAPGGQGYSTLTAVCGFAVLATFYLQQRGASAPVLPRAVMCDPTFVLPNLASIALHLVVFAVPLLTPYYLERIAGHAPATSGAALACTPAGILLGSMLAPAIVRLRGARSAALAGGVLVVLCQFALGLWTDSPAFVSLLIVLAIHGIGIGLFGVAYTDIVVAALPRTDRGVAGSLTMLTRTIGVVAGAVALMAALSTLETRAIAAGLSTTAAFRQAYAHVFQGSALLLAVVLPLCFLRSPLRISHD